MPEQTTLFDLGAPSAAAPIWERRGSPLGQMFAVHIHTPSGWEVHHCCHPTANFPYYLLTAQKTVRVAPNGRGFQRLDLAKQHVEQLFSPNPAGALETATEDLRTYNILMYEPHKPLAIVDVVVGHAAARSRADELQSDWNNDNPFATCWTRNLFTLQLETETAPYFEKDPEHA